MVHAPRAEIVVGVSDCRIAAPPTAYLATYALGSCVAIVAWDWKAKVGALLHAMLPDSSMDRTRARFDPFCFVDTGTAEMLRKMEAQGALKKRMRCCVAGGASMIVDPAQFEIGKRNYLAVKKAFWKLGLFIDQEHVGGTETRSLRLDLESGRIDMKTGAGPRETIVPAAGINGINLMGKGENDASSAR